MHQFVARFACAVHFAFVAFTLIGGLLAWLFPWVLVPHLAAAAWGGRMATTRTGVCPLSRMENWGRAGAGLPRLHERGFIAHYFENRLYPARRTRRVEAAVASLVLGSWLGFTLR